MKFDAVEQRSADLVHVALYLVGCAHAGVGGVTVISAGTRIHGGDEHERARIFDGVFGATDGDLAVLEGLT